MKKLLFIIPLLLIAGCTNQDSYFTKKQECSKYLTQVEKEVDDIQGQTSNYASKPEVYYSPKLDTCISTYTLYSGDGSFRAFEINDLLTNEQIYFKTYTGEEISDLFEQGLNGFEEYNEKKEELKMK